MELKIEYMTTLHRHNEGLIDMRSTCNHLVARHVQTFSDKRQDVDKQKQMRSDKIRQIKTNEDATGQNQGVGLREKHALNDQIEVSRSGYPFMIRISGLGTMFREASGDVSKSLLHSSSLETRQTSLARVT